MPKKGNYLLGLTIEDISITKKNRDGTVKQPIWRYNDFGIMGLAFCPGNSCIVSSCRLHCKDKKRFVLRLQKIAIHELGHNLGLSHCLNKNCVMTSAAEKISTIDNEALMLCKSCKKKLAMNN